VASPSDRGRGRRPFDSAQGQAPSRRDGGATLRRNASPLVLGISPRIAENCVRT
jgi:hypothetical protein